MDVKKIEYVEIYKGRKVVKDNGCYWGDYALNEIMGEEGESKCTKCPFLDGCYKNYRGGKARKFLLEQLDKLREKAIPQASPNNSKGVSQ